MIKLIPFSCQGLTGVDDYLLGLWRVLRVQEAEVKMAEIGTKNILRMLNDGELMKR